jgi:hypothetical protein
MWSELVIGGNRIINCSGVIRVDGDPQVYLERGTRDVQLLLTINVCDETGKTVAKLRRNAWAYNDKSRYDITTHPSSLTLTDTTTGEVILEASVKGRDAIEVPRANFYTRGGERIEIRPDALVVWPMQLTLAGNEIRGMDSALDINRGFLAIGVAGAPEPGQFD